MNGKRTFIIVIPSVVIIMAGIILYTLFRPSGSATQEGRPLQEQQIENYIQQNNSRPVIQTDEDLLNDLRNN